MLLGKPVANVDVPEHGDQLDDDNYRECDQGKVEHSVDCGWRQVRAKRDQRGDGRQHRHDEHHRDRGLRPASPTPTQRGDNRHCRSLVGEDVPTHVVHGQNHCPQDRRARPPRSPAVRRSSESAPSSHPSAGRSSQRGRSQPGSSVGSSLLPPLAASCRPIPLILCDPEVPDNRNRTPSRAPRPRLRTRFGVKCVLDHNDAPARQILAITATITGVITGGGAGTSVARLASAAGTRAWETRSGGEFDEVAPREHVGHRQLKEVRQVSGVSADRLPAEAEHKGDLRL